MKFINSKTPITWSYVDTIQNPGDIRSRGSKYTKNLQKEWWDGPSWLAYPEHVYPGPSKRKLNQQRNLKKSRDDERSHQLLKIFEIWKVT